jgi:hypothetical protein
MKKVKATIKSTSGTEITIESDRQTIGELVDWIHRREQARERFREEFEKRRELEKKRNDKQNKLINHNITKGEENQGSRSKQNMILDACSEKSKSITEIKEDLRKKGHNYGLHALSPTLLRLTRRGLLVRDLNEQGNWAYSRNKSK